MGQLDDYLAGRPLSAENAALMAGIEPAAEWQDRAQGERTAKELSPLHELTEDDRRWLRRLYHEPGYEIFLRLLNSCILRREEGAKLLSSTDPLSNSKAIIDEWTYIACFKTVLRDIQQLIHDGMSQS